MYQVTFHFLKRWARRKERRIPVLLSRYIYYPGLFIMFTLTLSLGMVFIEAYIGDRISEIIHHGLKIAAIAGTGFLIMRIITVLREVALYHSAGDVEEDDIDYSLRKAKTKFLLLQRALNFLIIIGTISIILMTFQGIRQVGSTILASAGVVGLIIGFAAQKSLGTLFAGIQIAITQPMRLDHLVVVEGTLGTISEITLTYVVIKTWDGRRVTIPINYFLETPFENWTRVSSEIVGNVTDIAGIGSGIFTLVTTIMLIIWAVKAFKGKPVHIEMIDDLTNWFEEKIGPINKS